MEPSVAAAKRGRGRRHRVTVPATSTRRRPTRSESAPSAGAAAAAARRPTAAHPSAVDSSCEPVVGQVRRQEDEPHVERSREDADEDEPGADRRSVTRDHRPEGAWRSGGGREVGSLVQADPEVEADQAEGEGEQERQPPAPARSARRRTGRPTRVRPPRCRRPRRARWWPCANPRADPTGCGVPDSRRNVIDGLSWPPDAKPCTSLSSTRATGAATPIVDHEGSRPMAAVAPLMSSTIAGEGAAPPVPVCSQPDDDGADRPGQERGREHREHRDQPVRHRSRGEEDVDEDGGHRPVDGEVVPLDRVGQAAGEQDPGRDGRGHASPVQSAVCSPVRSVP